MCCRITSEILGVTVLSEAMSVWSSSPPLENKHRHGSTTLCCSTQDAPFSPQPHLTVSPSDCTFNEELFLRALCEEDSDDDTEADPVLDDLYLRRVQQTLHQTSTNPSYDRFLPRNWTPEEAVRVRTIYLGSQRRPWYRKLLGLRSVHCFLFIVQVWKLSCFIQS